MGTLHSKAENENVPATPVAWHCPITVETSFEEMDNCLEDPRSPTHSICRTPLSEIAQLPSKDALEKQMYQQDIEISGNNAGPGTMALLKKKLFKGFTYNLNDPRSPSVEMNRTPIVFDCNEKSFSLDDTFADLFVDPPTTENPTEEVAYDNQSQGAAQIECDQQSPTVEVTPKAKEIVKDVIERDPRSPPSVDVDRTPIMFTDDCPDENEMIESVLENLSLSQHKKLENKPLERVRNYNRKKSSKKNLKNIIYEDNENVFSSPITRKGKDFAGQFKRTPLGCVGSNTNPARSLSVNEGSAKIGVRKMRLPFDENNENSFEIF